jgi:uncharacterized protein
MCGRSGGRTSPKTTSPPINVTPDEVEQVLYARPRLVLRGAEGAEYAFGTTEAGRYLLVVLAEAVDGRAYVVTARDMTDAERQAFRRKGR